MSYDIWDLDSGNRIGSDLTEHQAKKRLSELVGLFWSTKDLSAKSDAWEQAISGDELRRWVEGE